jgi:predicted amidophosphoribosyltransferase
LVAPIPLHQDRQAKHIEFAQTLRLAQETKRAAAKVRAADKKLAAANDIALLCSGSKKRKILSMEMMNGKGREPDGLGRPEVIEQ